MTKNDELIKEYEKIDEEEINKPDYSCLTNNNITQYKSDLGFKTLVQGLDQGLYVIPNLDYCSFEAKQLAYINTHIYRF